MGSLREVTDRPEVRIVDLATARTLADSRVLDTRREPQAGTQRDPVDPVYLPDGRLAVLMTTVFVGGDPSGEYGDFISVDVLDPTTGDVSATVQGPVAFSGDLAPAGKGLALVSEHLNLDGGSGVVPRRLHVWDGTGDAFRELGGRIVAAAR